MVYSMVNILHPSQAHIQTTYLQIAVCDQKTNLYSTYQNCDSNTEKQYATKCFFETGISV